VAALWLEGLRGKKSTPSIGWEVSVRSQWSTSGSSMELKCGMASSGYSTSVTRMQVRLFV
jgi:hypothetical protein